MELLKILFIITLLILPLGELGRYIFPALGTIPIILNDVTVGITVFVWIFEKLQKKEKIEGKLLKPLLVFFSVCLLSLLLNILSLSLPHFLIASLYLIRFILYASLYFVVRDFDKKFKEKVILFLLIVGQITIVIGYFQLFLYPSLRNLYYLGWDEHLYRIFSVFFDPNFTGVFFVLVFFLTFGKAWESYKDKRKLMAILLAIFSFFDVIAVYLTYSRSALFMLICSSIIFLWMYGKKKYILGFISLFLVLIFLSPKSFQSEGTNIFRIASSEARLQSAQTAISIFSKSSILGVGFNAYRYAQNRQGFLTDSVWEQTHAGAGTDNSYLFILATTGVVGFIAYMYLLLQIARLCLSKKQSLFSLITFVSFVGICISSFFINSLFYIFIMEWLWIILGFIESR